MAKTTFKEWLQFNGACILIILTVLQVLCFIGYSILYTIVYEDYHTDTKLTRVELY